MVMEYHLLLNTLRTVLLVAPVQANTQLARPCWTVLNSPLILGRSTTIHEMAVYPIINKYRGHYNIVKVFLCSKTKVLQFL